MKNRKALKKKHRNRRNSIERIGDLLMQREVGHITEEYLTVHRIPLVLNKFET